MSLGVYVCMYVCVCVFEEMLCLYYITNIDTNHYVVESEDD